MTIHVVNNPLSLRQGSGTAGDPYNAANRSTQQVFAALRPFDSVAFGPGVYEIECPGNVAVELPDGVSIRGAGRDATAFWFRLGNPVDHFIGFRHSGEDIMSQVSFGSFTAVMPDQAAATTAIQAFGDRVDVHDVTVVGARGHDYKGQESGSGLAEGFPIFASNRVAGANAYRTNASGIAIGRCQVMYADQDWRAYSTGITADAEGVKGSVLDCGVNGICHAAYTGSAHINACTSNGPEHFYYHDTFGSGEMSLTDCTAVGAETLFKTISAGGLRGAIIKECRIYPMVQEAAVYLVYLVNASNVEIRDCQMILDGPGPAGFLGADISTCRDIRLLGNVLAADVASAVVQAPDTFAGISGWRSIGNRLRLPTGLQALYTDTM